jgi:hypothetical protein
MGVRLNSPSLTWLLLLNDRFCPSGTLPVRIQFHYLTVFGDGLAVALACIQYASDNEADSTGERIKRSCPLTGFSVSLFSEARLS